MFKPIVELKRTGDLYWEMEILLLYWIFRRRMITFSVKSKAGDQYCNSFYDLKVPKPILSKNQAHRQLGSGTFIRAFCVLRAVCFQRIQHSGRGISFRSQFIYKSDTFWRCNFCYIRPFRILDQQILSTRYNYQKTGIICHRGFVGNTGYVSFI